MNNNLSIPKYPQDFYDYSNGLKISEEEINSWINECIEKLSVNESQSSYSISTGNTMVEVYKVETSKDNYDYAVIVCKNYQESITNMKENYNDNNLCSIN